MAASTHNPSAEEHVRAARAKAAFLRPYFSHALYALILRQAVECPTMAVDKFGRCYYNVEFVLSCSVDEIATVFLHEIGHILRRHHERSHALGITMATQHIANWAQDGEINDDLAEEVKTRRDLTALPGNCIYPSTFGLPDGKVWEWYYGQLMDMAAKMPPEDGDGDGLGGEGEGEGKDSKGKGKGKGKGGGSGAKNRKHKCGSGAHGVHQPWEEEDPGKTGAEGVDDADWKDIERRVAEGIKEESKKGRGTVPGTWVEWADNILRPTRIPWDHELAGAVRWAINDVSGKVMHNYRRPSRRQQSTPDVVFPCMRRPIPNVAFVGDTSGSMSSNALALVRGVVEDVCQAVGASLSFIATDAAAHGVQKVQNGRSIEMRGRGGTNMCVGIEAAMEEVRPRPDVIIVATDCDTPWPAEEPGARMIVVAVEASEHGIANVPDWARCIVVEAEEAAAA